jgi:hypothetical protein
MPYVNVDVDPNDVLSEVATKDLRAALDSRSPDGPDNHDKNHGRCITVMLDVDAHEVLSHADTDDLQNELLCRHRRGEEGVHCAEPMRLLEKAWFEVRGRCESPALREYFWQVLGKVA